MPTSSSRDLQLDRAVADLEHVAERDRRRRSTSAGTSAMIGAEQVQQPVGARGHDVFLQEELHRIGDQRVDEPEPGEAEDRRRGWRRCGPGSAALHLALEEDAQADHLQHDQQEQEDRLRRRRSRSRPPMRLLARRAASRSASACSTSRFSWYSALLICSTGAVPHEARHSTSSNEKRPSARRLAVARCRAGSRCACWISPAPRSAHGRFRQSWRCQRPDRLLPVHRVERRDRRRPTRAAAPSARRRTPCTGERQPAELALREPERRHERRAPLRIAGEDLAVLARAPPRRSAAPALSGHTRRRSC